MEYNSGNHCMTEIIIIIIMCDFIGCLDNVPGRSCAATALRPYTTRCALQISRFRAQSATTPSAPWPPRRIATPLCAVCASRCDNELHPTLSWWLSDARYPYQITHTVNSQSHYCVVLCCLYCTVLYCIVLYCYCYYHHTVISN